MRLTQQQLEAHLWGAANILRGKTAGQDYKNYILSLMFYKRLCDQWENEAEEAIAEQERQQGRQFTEAQKAIFRARGEHRFSIPDGSRWGDVLAASTNLGEKLTQAMRAVASADEELKGVFTVDWNQPAPNGSGKPLIPNEVVHALIQHFDSHDLSNASVPPDVLGRAYEYLNSHKLLMPGWSNSKGGRMRVAQSLLVESRQPKYAALGFSPDDGNPAFLDLAVNELADADGA